MRKVMMLLLALALALIPCAGCKETVKYNEADRAAVEAEGRAAMEAWMQAHEPEAEPGDWYGMLEGRKEDAVGVSGPYLTKVVAWSFTRDGQEYLAAYDLENSAAYTNRFLDDVKQQAEDALQGLYPGCAAASVSTRGFEQTFLTHDVTWKGETFNTVTSMPGVIPEGMVPAFAGADGLAQITVLTEKDESVDAEALAAALEKANLSADILRVIAVKEVRDGLWARDALSRVGKALVTRDTTLRKAAAGWSKEEELYGEKAGEGVMIRYRCRKVTAEAGGPEETVEYPCPVDFEDGGALRTLDGAGKATVVFTEQPLFPEMLEEDPVTRVLDEKAVAIVEEAPGLWMLDVDALTPGITYTPKFPER